LQNETITDYEYQSLPTKQRVLQITITDPLKNQIITTYNPRGQIVEIRRQDNEGRLRALSHKIYDLAGRQIEQQDTVIAPELVSGPNNYQIGTTWTYDAMGRVLSLTEAAKKHEEKITTYEYKQGRKTKITLPDQVTIQYEYDPFGRLQHYYSSDLSFDYVYQYDANGNVICVADSINHTETSRTYDDNNRITSEILANGHIMRYDGYDGLDRLLALKFADESSVSYTYDAGHLKKVSRLLPDNSIAYDHQYTHYDLTGKLLEEQTAGHFDILYDWDLLGRPTTIDSSYFKESVPQEGYDQVGNLLEKTRIHL